MPKPFIAAWFKSLQTFNYLIELNLSHKKFDEKLIKIRKNQA